MKAVKTLFFCSIMLSTLSFADRVDCKATEKIYQDQLNGLKRLCTKKTDCRSDNLNWDPCGKPVLNSDAESAARLTALLADLSKLCSRPARPCPALIAKPVCLDGMCEDSLDLGSKNDKIITLQFMQQSKPLAGATVTLDADTGIRCVTTPCPSRMNLKTFTTDDNGKIHMTVGEILGLLNVKSNPDVIHRDVGPDGYSVSINNVGYSGIDLTGLLVDTQKVVVIHF